MAQILGTGYQRAAKTARVTTGGNLLTFASWAVTMTGEDLDTTNFESYSLSQGQTFREGILGSIGCDNLTFGGDWDAHFAPLGTPPGLYPRDDLATTEFYTSRLDNVGWVFPYMRIRSAATGAAMGGKVTFTAGGSSQGTFNMPVGSV